MVSSSCSLASTESAPAGFLDCTVDDAASQTSKCTADEALVTQQSHYSTDDDNKNLKTQKFLVARTRPLSFSEGSERHHHSLISVPTLAQSKNKSHLERDKRVPSRLFSISRRGRFNSSLRCAPDFYPLPRWRPQRSRRCSFGSDIDLKQLNDLFKEFEWKNKRKSVIRFFDGR